MACWVKSNMIPSVARQMIREYIYAYSACHHKREIVIR